jgi:hypothetical protein
MATDTTTTNGQPAPSTALAKPPPPPPDHGGAIDVFASSNNFAQAQRMALALASSTMVPDAYRGQGNVSNVLIALDMASRIGASVLAVMQNLHIIHGRPGWSSAFLVGSVNSCGRFSPLRYRFEGKPGTDEWGCRAYAKEKASGEECVGSLITIGLAKAEGWSSKSGSKWKTMPEQMLMYRAAAFWTRAFAPEISLGMQTAEEVHDVFDSGAELAPLPVALQPGDAKALEAELLGQDLPKPPKSDPQTVDAEPVK